MKLEVWMSEFWASNAVALCYSMCRGRDPVLGVATLPTSWIVELLGQSPQECCSIELKMC